MTLKKYLFGIFTATMLCWAGFILTLLNLDPTKNTKLALVAFFASLFFGIIGTLTLVGFYLRVWLSKKEVIYAHISPSARQAILISLYIIIILALQAIRLVNIWTASLLAIAILFLEFFFRARPHKVKKI